MFSVKEVHSIYNFVSFEGATATLKNKKVVSIDFEGRYLLVSLSVKTAALL